MALGLTMSGCANNASTLELSGTLYMKGSMPHTYLVLEEDATHTDYKITNATSLGLANKQNQHVGLKAKLIRKAKGPGFPAEIEVVEVR
jgi:hypothetical protein